MRRWTWVIAALVAVTTIMTLWVAGRSTAQEDDWAAYLTNPATGEWLKISADGTAQPLDFRLLVGEYAIDDAGTRLATCATDDNTATVTVYNLATGNPLMSVQLNDVVGCAIGQQAFTPDGEQVWVGVAGDPQAGQSAWKLVNVRLTGLPPIRTLDSASPIASVIEAAGGPMMPYVFAADGQQVVFGIAPYGIGGAASIPAFRWDGAEELLPIADWGRFGARGLLASDEVVWPEVDPNLPAAESDGMMPAYNIVNYRDASGATIPIFHSPNALISEVAWVNRGQQVVITLLSPIGGQLVPEWVLLNRDGPRSTIEGGVEGRVLDSRDGLVTLSQRPSADSGENQAVLMRYIGATGETIWTGDPAYRLLWATPSAPAPNLPPFAVLGSLDATLEPEATLTAFPSATPTVGFTHTPTVGFTSTSTIGATNTPRATNTRVAPTATDTPIAAPPTATSGGLRPPSGQTRTATTAAGPSATATRQPSLTVAPSSTSARTNTPRPSSTSTAAPTNTRAPGGPTPTSTLRRGQLASPTPNTGPTTRPASATSRPSSTPAPTQTRTPTFTPSRTLTRTPAPTLTRTMTPTVPLVPSKTPLPTSGGLPTKAPISGPTSTLDTGGGGGLRLRITNNAGTDLCEIYFTPNTESTWGENYLEDGDILADGASMDWVVDPAIYDVKVFDCFSNSLEEYGFDLTAGSLEIDITSSAMTGSPLR